jgi:hypothetical protein
LRRREFITLLGSAAATWPLAAHAQQAERMRRISVFTGVAADDTDAQIRDAAFQQGLALLGWTEGRNVQIDYRWGAGKGFDARKIAAELAALAPDVILAVGSTTMGPLLQVTRTVPIVFVIVPDPVGSGFVASLSRPGRNATGFIRIRIEWEMARTAKADRPEHDAGGGPLGSRCTRRDWSVRCTSVCGAVIGLAPFRFARCRRGRSCHHSVRARGEWRSSRDGERVVGVPS